MPAPAGLARLGLVSDEKRTAVHHQKKRPQALSVSHGTVNIHPESQPVRLSLMQDEPEGRNRIPDRRFRTVSDGLGIGDILINHCFIAGLRIKRSAHKAFFNRTKLAKIVLKNEEKCVFL